jgi:hypothetical protein
MYVSLLRPIIFSGHDDRNKFLLIGFPETTEQVTEFEKACSTLNAIVFANDHIKDKNEAVIPPMRVDIRNNETSLFNIDSMF